MMVMIMLMISPILANLGSRGVRRIHINLRPTLDEILYKIVGIKSS
jgi:hypothetical protein